MLTTSRSQFVASKACARLGFWGYHYRPTPDSPPGLQGKGISIPLLTGAQVHEGVAYLFQGKDVDMAVYLAQAGFRAALDEGDLLVDPKGEKGQRSASSLPSDLVSWTISQELALIEAQLRAFHQAILPALQREFTILEVEPEGAPITLGKVGDDYLFWQWRPDGILMKKDSDAPQLVLLSIKTAASWGKLQALSLSRDDQSFSEIWSLDKVIRHWHANPNSLDIPAWYRTHCLPLPQPPEIAGMQLGIFLKGIRKEDKSTPGRYIQHSPLIRAYRQEGAQGLGEDQWAWSWDVPKVSKEGNAYVGTLGSKWKPANVWESYPGGVKAWISALASGQIQPECGDALLAQFIFPEIVPKREEMLESWAGQMILHEVEESKSAAYVNAALRNNRDSYPFSLSVLNEYFPQTLGACVRYGGLCPFEPICFGSPQTLLDPMGTGLYVSRKPHHEGLEEEG